MDMQWQIQVIEDLIKENPEATAKDFIELKAEVEAILAATEKYKLFKIGFIPSKLKQAS